MVEKLRRIRELTDNHPYFEIWVSLNEDDNYNILLIVYCDQKVLNGSIKKYQIEFCIEAGTGDITTADENERYPFNIAASFIDTIEKIKNILMD